MSPKAKEITEQFETLSNLEQWGVFEAIARDMYSAEYGELSDEELTATASQTFAMLDEEESSANPR